MGIVGDAVGELGPCSTQKLGQYLIDKCACSSEAARKRIQRARQSKEILTATFNLSHNQQFVYLKRHEGTKLLRTKLFKTIQDDNSSLRLPLSGIQARGGMIPEALFMTFSGLPISGRNPTASQALAVLQDNGMLAKVPGEDFLQLDPLFTY